MSDRLIYGLDFGTTNSAVVINDGDNIIQVPIGAENDEMLRSVTFFPDDSEAIYTGVEAVRQYVACGMKGRFMQSIKTFLPDTLIEKTYVRDRWYELDELIAIIVTELKQAADIACSEDVKRVIMGRPAVFAKRQDEEMLAVERLENAARLAGFEEIRFQIEPVAAALIYEQTLENEELVLVVDSGGGTTDFTVMQLHPVKEARIGDASDVLATGGLGVAGDRFNTQIMWKRLIRHFGSDVKWRSYNKWLDMPRYLMKAISEWRRIPFLKARDHRQNIRDILNAADDKEPVLQLQTLIEDNLGFSLFETIDAAKCELSEKESCTIEFHKPGVDLTEELMRIDFERMILEEVLEIGLTLSSTLDKAGVEVQAIDSVFMTGGSSLMPRLRQLVMGLFGAEKIRSGDNFTSVARGLAMSAHLFDWD